MMWPSLVVGEGVIIQSATLFPIILILSIPEEKKKDEVNLIFILLNI